MDGLSIAEYTSMWFLWRDSCTADLLEITNLSHKPGQPTKQNPSKFPEAAAREMEYGVNSNT